MGYHVVRMSVDLLHVGQISKGVSACIEKVSMLFVYVTSCCWHHPVHLKMQVGEVLLHRHFGTVR